MSKAVSRGQALQIAARVATQINWDELDGDRLQDEVISLTSQEFGARFTAFLKNNAKVIVRESKIIRIDRAVPFDLEAFVGQESDLKIAEQDMRSVILSDIDVSKISLLGCITDRKGRFCLHGHEKLAHLISARHVRLDAKIFQTLWENQQLIPEHWKEPTYGIATRIFFHGTVLSGRRKEDRYVFFLYFADNRWKYGHSWLENACLFCLTSAVLPAV